ncbi:MAG TPA: hypothetical protein VNF73_09210 [Candidatus Saccharimonadales bacterium]|nr:hypothetical protein [Candidatus Saccharimonadales bacterium]
MSAPAGSAAAEADADGAALGDAEVDGAANADADADGAALGAADALGVGVAAPEQALTTTSAVVMREPSAHRRMRSLLL